MPLNVKHRREPWFRGKFTYIKPVLRDVYGKPRSFERVELPGTCRIANIEIVDASATRGYRKALMVETGVQDFFEMNDHIEYADEEYTIIGIDKLENYRGEWDWVKITCLDKRGTA